MLPYFFPSANEPPSTQCSDISDPTSLYDVYLVVPPNRARPVYDTLAHTPPRQASIQLNQKKPVRGTQESWLCITGNESSHDD